MECQYYGKMGHLRRECRNKMNKDGNDGNASWSGSQEVNVANEILQDALILSLDKNGEYWVIDFGASFHATSHWEYSIDYIVGDYGEVLLGNDHSCKIIRISTISMKLPNGSQWTLYETRHIPDLKRNFI